MITIQIETEKFSLLLMTWFANINTNKKFQATITNLFIRCRKLNTSLVFIMQFYFFCSKRSQIKVYILLNKEDP